jgi:hypothetical protein
LERKWANEENKRRRNIEHGQRKEITSAYLEEDEDEEGVRAVPAWKRQFIYLFFITTSPPKASSSFF